MTAKRIDQNLPTEQPRSPAADWPGAGKSVRPNGPMPAERENQADSGRPGGGEGRVDVTGIVSPEIRVDPNLTEGHPGYQDSGGSELRLTEPAPETLPRRGQRLSIASVVFGVLGGAFCWWTPLGMVLSLTGLVLGFISWLNTGAQPRQHGLAMAGILLSAATFILGLVLAVLGLELIQLMPYR